MRLLPLAPLLALVPIACAQAPRISILHGESYKGVLYLFVAAEKATGENRCGFWYTSDGDPSDASKMDRRTAAYQVRGAARGRQARTGDLAPGVTYQIGAFCAAPDQKEPDWLRCVERCENCSFGGEPTPLDCSAAGAWPTVTPEPYDASITPPTPPEPPHFGGDPRLPPTCDTSIDAEVDSRGRIENLQALLSRAAALDSDRNHCIELPRGSSHYGDLSLPAKSGAGTVVVRGGGDARNYPPPGVMTNPSYLDLLPKLYPPLDNSWLGRNRRLSPFSADDGASGYRFENVAFLAPPPNELPVEQYEVIVVDGPTVTLSSAEHGVQVHQLVLLDLPGVTGLQGAWQVGRVQGEKVTLAGDFDVRGELESPGTLTQAQAWEVGRCSAGDNPVCETVVPRHGIPELERLPIFAIGGEDDAMLSLANLRKGGREGIRQHAAVLLSGTPGGRFDGIHRAVGARPDSVRLAVSLASCGVDCGVAQQLIPVYVEGVPCIDDGRYHYQVVAPNAIRLLGARASSACSGGGGFLTLDPAMTLTFVDFTAGERIALDRVLIDPGAPPYRTVVAYSPPRRDGALLNSMLLNAQFWLPIDPLTKFWRGSFFHNDLGIATAVAVNLQGRRRQLFENVSIHNAHGLVLYAESTNSADQASDLRFHRVMVGSTQQMTAGSPESDGRAYQSRHVFEMKNGQRVAADGMVFYQGNDSSENRAAAILLSPRGRAADDPTPIAMRDFSFRDVAVIGSPSCVEHASESQRQINQAPTLRVRYENILCDIDWQANQMAPSSMGGVDKPNFFAGFWFSSAEVAADIEFDRLTYIGRSAKGGGFQMLGYRSSQFAIHDSILTVNRCPACGFFVSAHETTFIPDNCDGRGAAAFNCITSLADGSPSPYVRFDNNLLISGIAEAETADASTLRSRDPRRNLTRKEVEDYYTGFGRFEKNLVLGSRRGEDSLAERLAVVFEEDSYQPRSQFADKGFDPQRLRRTMGYLSPIAIRSSGPGELTLEWTALTADPDERCAVDYAPTGGDWGEGWFGQPGAGRAEVEPGGGPKRVVLSGLESGTLYDLRWNCPVYQPISRISVQ